MSDGEFERRLSIASVEGSAVEAIGDRMVGFAVDTLFAGVSRLGVVVRLRLRL